MYRRQSYGIGGALLKVGSNLAQGKGFGSGALQGVGKAAITPGSGIGAGAELAGNLLQKADNPLAQKIGKGLDVASNFAPGGGGIAGAVGDVAGLAAGAGAGGAAGALGNLAQNVLGQAHGGGIPHNPELAGAPYKMRGVKLMKAGGINEYGAGGNIYAEVGVNTTGAQPPQTDGEVMRQEMLAQRQSEREMENSGGLGRRALDVSRGVDMDRGISGQLDSGAAYSGPKYRMAELNEISRGAYDNDIDYSRLAASMGNASSKHKSALSNILANQTAMNQQRVGGIVVKKKTVDADGGVLSDPPKDPSPADWLLDYGKQDINSSILDEARDLSRARSDRESAFGTSSTDVFMPVGNIPTMPDPEPTEEPSPRMEPVEPLRPLGPKIIRRDTNRDIEGGTRTFESEERDDRFTGFITAPYLRSGQVPTNMKVRNPETGQFQDRQMEPEEIADYIYRNQVRRRVPSQMMNRDQAMERALGIMKFRS